MAFDIRSFFVGIATVVGLLSVGFGGGLMMGRIMSGDTKAPNKIERQAAKPPDAAAKDTSKDAKEIKPNVEPVAVTPPAQPAPAPQPTQAQAAPAPAPEPVATQPAPPAQPKPETQPAPPAPAPTMTAETPPQPALGSQRQVSLPQPSAEPQGLSRREDARLRAQQRREERARRREERRQQMAERRRQEELRREELRARQPQDADDDDDGEQERPVMRPRGLFDLFRSFGDGSMR
jgi:hypothetical protein